MKRKILLSPRHPGSNVLAPMVTLLVRTRYGTFAPLPFAVDSGADTSALPVDLAQREGILFPRTEAARSVATGLVGAVERYRGLIHVRLFGEEFDWPCDFLDAPPHTAPIVRAYGVLGRAGFLGAFRFCLDDRWLTLARRRGALPWWRLLLPRFAREHAPDLPL
jgi:hypothetical protein